MPAGAKPHITLGQFPAAIHAGEQIVNKLKLVAMGFPPIKLS